MSDADEIGEYVRRKRDPTCNTSWFPVIPMASSTLASSRRCSKLADEHELFAGQLGVLLHMIVFEARG